MDEHAKFIRKGLEEARASLKSPKRPTNVTMIENIG
jgi:hypothetical protein